MGRVWTIFYTLSIAKLKQFRFWNCTNLKWFVRAKYLFLAIQMETKFQHNRNISTKSLIIMPLNRHLGCECNPEKIKSPLVFTKQSHVFEMDGTNIIGRFAIMYIYIYIYLQRTNETCFIRRIEIHNVHPCERRETYIKVAFSFSHVRRRSK